MGIFNKRKKEVEPSSKRPTSEEVTIAKKVVFDHMAVKNAVKILRDFGKEFGINMLDPKGLAEAAPIIRKRDEEDRVNQRIDEKIAPLNNKIDKLTELIMGTYQQQNNPRKEFDENIDQVPEYVRQKIAQNNKRPPM